MPNLAESNVMTTKKVEEILDKEKYALKLKRSEIIWFSRKPGVRRSGISFAMTKLERQEYAKCKLSVFYFAQKYCKIKREDGTVGEITLRDYQKDIIKLFNDNRYSILMASRQTGKTVSTAIYILWYALFHDNKGIMIVANKSKTTKEIINKIKGIYKLLPFSLKVGVVNWNESSISFENGSRIQTEARTSEPAIGFTIDLLYLDEFAKVPESIVRKYYGEVVPVVSSIEDSKIIITSTPDGFNLFWELMTGAEKPEDDDEYNGYNAMRVYWYQKKGRRDTKIILSNARLKKYVGVNKTSIVKYLKSIGYKVYEQKIDNSDVILVKFFKDDKEKFPHPKSSISDIRKIMIPMPDGKKMPLAEISRITNWEEEQTKLIGGESMFRQEYGLEYITDDKTLFDTIKFQQMTQNIKTYEHIEIESFSRKLPIPYTSLQFVNNDIELFDFGKVKDYFIFIGVDLAEGLGIDYSVINIFRVCPKEIDWIENNRESINTLYDFFKLEQIGMWRSNIYKINEIAHIIYMLIFEFFDPEKVKVVVEMNKNLGNLLFQSMLHVFDGENDYGDAVFMRFKHNQNDKFTKKGLLIGRDKKYMIKEFQDNVYKDNLVLNNQSNIIELKSFAKKETPSGDVTYKSQSGHDDMVMSCVNLSAAFQHPMYKESIERYIDYGLPEEYKPVILNYMDKRGDNSINVISDTYSRIYNKGIKLQNDNTLNLSGNRKYNIGIKNIDNWYKNK